MISPNKRLLYVSISLFVLFAVFTVLVATVDVATANVVNSQVTETKIGFSHLNIAFFDKTHPDGTYSPVWYKFTDIIGKAALLEAAGFAVYGIYQLIKRKSLKKVDADLYVLAAAYLLLALCYIVFEIFPVNYRPVLLGDKPEASYPSSHTMLTCTIAGTGIAVLNRRISSKLTRISADILSGVAIFVMIIGRALSGVHYLTDIFGGVLLSSAIVFLYLAFSSGIIKAEKSRESGNESAEK